MVRFLRKFWWFLALVAIATFFFFTRMQSTTINARHKQFAVENPNAISSITLNNDTISLSLKKDNGQWYVNGSSPARTDAVEAMLFLISRIQASSPLPLSVADSLIEVIEKNGLEVKIFDGKKVVREYRVYQTSSLALGGIGLLKNSKYAFQLSIPSYSSDVVELFFTDPSSWVESKTSLARLENSIAVEVEIPEEPEKSFRIDISNSNQHRLFALFYGKAASSFDSENATRYLNHLNSLTVEMVKEKITSEELSAILFSQPDFIITLYFSDIEKKEIRFYPIPIEEYLDEFGRPVRFDLNRMYISLSQHPSSLYEAKYMDIFPILKDISFFNPKFEQ